MVDPKLESFQKLAPSKAFDCTDAFNELFSHNALIKTFLKRFQFSSAKGIDRLNGYQFAGRYINVLPIVSVKCLAGSFRFSPYLENLRPKKRQAFPRLISVPTIRDRIVLNQLKDLLALAFPECVPRDTASSLVRSVATDIKAKLAADTWVCGCDIREFYPSLDQKRLLGILQSRLSDPRALKLVARSLVTPTIPSATRRRDHANYAQRTGVAQGLAVSNILAAIYMSPIDSAMKKAGVSYTRYVDDVLMFGEEGEIRKQHRSFVARSRYRRLRVHKLGAGKSHITPLLSGFSYLGYVFAGSNITVRESTIDRLLHSLASRFSDYRHNKTRKLARNPHLNEATFNAIFLEELNERITGAVFENRRFGWVAYFSQITDLTLLYKLDAAVVGLFKRMPDFGNKAPTGLRKFGRAHFEIRFNPHGGYIRDFDVIKSETQKLAFLLSRGRVSPSETLSSEQIESRYELCRRKILSAMQADEGMIY